jgi:hypothetical protein
VPFGQHLRDRQLIAASPRPWPQTKGACMRIKPCRTLSRRCNSRCGLCAAQTQPRPPPHPAPPLARTARRCRTSDAGPCELAERHRTTCTVTERSRVRDPESLGKSLELFSMLSRDRQEVSSSNTRAPRAVTWSYQKLLHPWLVSLHYALW